MIESNIQTILYFIDDKLIFRLFRYFDKRSFQKCVILKWNCFCDFLWFRAEQPETLPRIVFQLASEFRVMEISCPSGLDVLDRPVPDRPIYLRKCDIPTANRYSFLKILWVCLSNEKTE